MAGSLERRVAHALVAVIAAAVLGGCGSAAETSTSSTLIGRVTSTTATNSSSPSSTTDAANSSVVVVPSTLRPGCERVDGFDEIGVDELPEEAIETIEAIEEDGPFRFDQDGATFQNRERLLPGHQRGYYREFTVITPGEGDRGARRIVTGDCDEMFYTDDHYASFQLIEG